MLKIPLKRIELLLVRTLYDILLLSQVKLTKWKPRNANAKKQTKSYVVFPEVAHVTKTPYPHEHGTGPQ